MILPSERFFLPTCALSPSLYVDVLALQTTVPYIPLERVLYLAWAFFLPIQWMLLGAHCRCTSVS